VGPSVEALDEEETVSLQGTIVATLSVDVRNKLIKRLQRIEGQVRGVRRMLEEERDCVDIVTQLAAIRGAVHQTSVLVVQEYAVNCLNNPDQQAAPEEMVARLVQTLGQMPR
jgi:DNA-binding FrmR family transcriptional regulator